MIPPENMGILAILAGLCIIIQFAPYRLLDIFFLPLDYYRYVKLHRLEWRVSQITQTNPRSKMLVRPARLDAEKYTAVISSLDNYPYIPSTAPGQRLKAQIDAVMPNHSDYPDLANALLENL